MDLKTKSPYSARLDQDTKDLVQELVENHGFVLDPQDPILLLHTVNKRTILQASELLRTDVSLAIQNARQALAEDRETQRQQSVQDAGRLMDDLQSKLLAALDYERLASQIQAVVCREVQQDVSQLLQHFIDSIRKDISQCLSSFSHAQNRTHMIYSCIMGAAATACAYIVFRS